MRPIPLSPIDHVFTGRGSYPLEFVFAYSGPIDPGRLHDSLRETLTGFLALSSRLVRLDDGRLALAPSEDGCVFETASSPTSFAETTARTVFVAPVETVEGAPLARVRLTRTPSGSVLGVGVSHAVADGFSYFHFLASWSRVFRGEPPLGSSHDRERLWPAATRSCPEDPAAVREGCGLFLDGPRPERDRGSLSWTRRLFPRDELRALMEEAQAGCPVRLSHNDVVAAWLWREQVGRWGDRREPTAWLSCPVDVRRRLPGFPLDYFGCAVALAVARVPRAALCTEPLSALAHRVRNAVAAVDADVTTRSLETIEGLRRAAGDAVLERLHVVHPRAGLLVTNLSRLPVREIAFDAGPPAAFDVLVPAERCALVLPAADGLDVRVCVPQGSGREC